jgi:hypothetical protein
MLQKPSGSQNPVSLQGIDRKILIHLQFTGPETLKFFPPSKLNFSKGLGRLRSDAQAIRIVRKYSSRVETLRNTQNKTLPIPKQLLHKCDEKETDVRELRIRVSPTQFRDP